MPGTSPFRLSGEAKLLKPDLRVFQLLLERYAIDPKRVVYIDDHSHNVEAARKLGMHGIHFTGPPALRSELRQIGLL